MVSNLLVLFCPCVVRKVTEHVGTKVINWRHQAQKGFSGIFVGIPQDQKGYLVYVTSSSNIISSYKVVFDESLSSAVAYMSQLYAEDRAILTAMSYIPYATSSREKTGDIITFRQCEEGNLLSENRNYAERGNESDDDSTMPPLIVNMKWL